MISLSDLPPEILHNIFDCLPLNQFVGLMQVNKLFRMSVLDWTGWRKVSLPRSIRANNIEMDKSLKIVSFIIPKINTFISWFDANGLSAFGDKHLEFLHRFVSRLQYLNLSSCSKISEQGLIDFFKISDPNCLACNICDNNSPHSKPLKELILYDLPSLTDQVLFLIGDRCNQLEKLEISQFRDYRFSDEGLLNFSLGLGAKHLRCLSIAGCKNITDAAIITVSKSCPNLQTFNCRGAFLIGDLGIESLLKNCLGLKNLDCSYCWRLSDAVFTITRQEGPVEEKPGHRLEVIDIQNCYQLGNATAVMLSLLPNLKSVCLVECPSINTEFKQRLKDCGIMLIDFQPNDG